MVKKLSIEHFIASIPNQVVLDVRSHIEFAHAAIPNAINMPLFNDEERKIVGTTYKQNSREAAIKVGLDFFGPKMKPIIEAVEMLINSKKEIEYGAIPSPTKVHSSIPIFLYCARGGMRSAAVAWLLDLYGFNVTTLIGGYKSYRNWVLQQFEKKFTLHILSGNTGSKKTKLLTEKSKTENVIDIEAIAHHKGSAFGNIGMPKQYSQEMFENILATQLHSFSTKNTNPIWLEDESQRLGTNIIPSALWQQMRIATVFFVNIPFEERLNNILEEYGSLPTKEVEASIIKISKRLGGLETKNALQFLETGDMKSCFQILLKYYDKYYEKGLQQREKHTIKQVTIAEIIN